jgi:hypothetical protein
VALISTLYGAAVLVSAFVFAVRLAVSPTWRVRHSTGGRDWRLLLALLVSLGVAGLVSGQFAHGSPWPALPVFAGLIWLTARRRQTLSALPAADLSPAIRRSLQAPTPAELIRHPWRSTKTNLRVIRQTFTPGSWRAERQWERDRGLR